jgi:hypothetical protein
VDPFEVPAPLPGAWFCLAVWNDRLYYSWGLGLPFFPLWGKAHGIGHYDGSAFVDDAVFYHNQQSAPPLDIDDPFTTDMLPTSRGLFIAMTPGNTVSLWDGSALISVVDVPGTLAPNYLPTCALGARMFIGPG